MDEFSSFDVLIKEIYDLDEKNMKKIEQIEAKLELTASKLR